MLKDALWASKNLDEAFEKGKKASAVVYCIVNKANQLVIIGIEKQGIRGEVTGAALVHMAVSVDLLRRPGLLFFC